MAGDGNANNTCHLLNVLKWRQAPVRDFTDLAILFVLLDAQLKRKKMNITSISELIGVSRATALRRINYFVENGLATTTENGNSRLISLTKTSAKLIDSIVSTTGCGKMGLAVERLFLNSADFDRL